METEYGILLLIRSNLVPEMLLNAEDWEIVCLVNREVTHYIQLLEDAREREAISAVFSISRLGNQLMQHNTPWKLVKVFLKYGSFDLFVLNTQKSVGFVII